MRGGDQCRLIQIYFETTRQTVTGYGGFVLFSQAGPCGAVWWVGGRVYPLFNQIKHFVCDSLWQQYGEKKRVWVFECELWSHRVSHFFLNIFFCCDTWVMECPWALALFPLFPSPFFIRHSFCLIKIHFSTKYFRYFTLIHCNTVIHNKNLMFFFFFCIFKWLFPSKFSVVLHVSHKHLLDFLMKRIHFPLM